jgi:geranylgeranyl diphosphate synthase type II
MAQFNLIEYLHDRRAVIDAHLDRLLPEDRGSRLITAMRYSLLAPGKRLRPILCMAAADAVGHPDSRVALPAACAIEMIHAYSLIHDDLPAMDDDDLRRGKPTCHMAFDEATAILAGDALLAMAFETLATMQLNGLPIADRQRIEAMRLVSRAAGYQGMVEGQMRDLVAEGQHLTPEALKALHHYKTGALIEVATHTGALWGGGNNEQTEQLLVFARAIGLAFQITDDILNVEGDPDIMGKATGTDHAREKNAYPALIGLAQSKIFCRELIDIATGALDVFDASAEPLRAIAGYVMQRRR